MDRDLVLTFLRTALVFGLSIGVALYLDRKTAARGLLPPGFRAPWRRGLAIAVVAVFLMIGVFAPLGTLGLKADKAPTQIATPQLFLLHFLMVIVIGSWFLLGFAGRAAQPSAPAVPEPPEPVPPPETGETGEPPALPVDAPVAVAPPPPRIPLGRQLAAQLGYLAPNIPREIGLGFLLGLGAWAAVIVTLLAIAGVLYAVGGDKILPQTPPAQIPLIAGLPMLTRLVVSLSAGIVEESFFRGFLQPRVGILVSTLCFALAHLSYGSPFLLVGVTLLSLIYAFLVKWRQNLWPAMAAHALFDGVQLLVIVPLALRALGEGGKAAAFLW
jgi:membrane protease YdiL (CAAX protease family)